VVLVLAAGLVVRAVLKGTSATSCESGAPTAAFATPATAAPATAAQAAAVAEPEPAAKAEPPAQPTAAAAAAASAAPAAGGPEASAPAAFVGTEIAGLAELNTLAADLAAVFVFVPGKGPEPSLPPAAPMAAAARTVSAQGKRVGLFTLKPGTADYAEVAGQTATPAVLAMVKGRGLAAVSGEVTETKLVQAYLTASNAGGGCCGGGAAAASCK